MGRTLVYGFFGLHLNLKLSQTSSNAVSRFSAHAQCRLHHACESHVHTYILWIRVSDIE